MILQIGPAFPCDIDFVISSSYLCHSFLFASFIYPLYNGLISSRFLFSIYSLCTHTHRLFRSFSLFSLCVVRLLRILQRVCVFSTLTFSLTICLFNFSSVICSFTAFHFLPISYNSYRRILTLQKRLLES